MRLIENLVTDLIRSQTGIDARRWVRRIGGGKLLLAGAGAALAATLAQRQNHGAAGHAVPPPPPSGGDRTLSPPPTPPPLPAAVPPPPPAMPGVAEAATSGETISLAESAVEGAAPSAEEVADTVADFEWAPEVTFAALRTMIAAAYADGELADEEKQILETRMIDLELPDASLAQIFRDLEKPPSLEALAATSDDVEVREVLYRVAALLVLADEAVSDGERRWLGDLAAAFAIPAERRQSIEAELLA